MNCMVEMHGKSYDLENLTDIFQFVSHISLIGDNVAIKLTKKGTPTGTIDIATTANDNDKKEEPVEEQKKNPYEGMSVMEETEARFTKESLEYKVAQYISEHENCKKREIVKHFFPDIVYFDCKESSEVGTKLNKLIRLGLVAAKNQNDKTGNPRIFSLAKRE